MSKKISVLAAMACVIVILGASNFTMSFSSSGNHPAIQHIIIVMQENHSFDNYFGVFPGVNNTQWGINPSICDPINLKNPSQGCVVPFNGDKISDKIEHASLNHGSASSHAAFNNGSNNGFVYAQREYGKPNQVLHADWSMAYFTNDTIPDYWDYASYYTLDANFFSSVLSYSFPNHVFSVAGDLVCSNPNRLDVCGPKGFNFTFPTMINALNSSGISWKYYGGDWSLSNDCKPVKNAGEFGHGGIDSKSQSFWNVLPDFPAIQLGASTCQKIQNQDSLFKDIASGNLPQVSWVTPYTNQSDHPALASFSASQMYISRLINALSQNSTTWDSTVVFLTWDEFGGFQDNVPPNQVDNAGFGFRVPLLIISPYSSSGVVIPSSQEDFSAFLSTIEANWNLPCLARDCSESSLLNLLNFNQLPKPPLILPANALAVYPVSTCISQALCKIGFVQPTYLNNPPIYPTFNASAPEDGDFT
jgi:phospholipase C